MEQRMRLLPPSAFEVNTQPPNQNFCQRGSPTVYQRPPLPSHSLLSSAPLLPPPPHVNTHPVYQPPVSAASIGFDVTSREAQLSSELQVLRQQLDSRGQAYSTQLNQSERELSELKAKQRETEQRHAKQIEEMEAAGRDRGTEVEKLKSYVSQQSTPSSQICKKQIDNLQHKVQSLEKEKQGLESNVELLNIRLRSHDQIQTIHDNELAQVGEVAPEKKKQVLLKRWRTKVYELLVQLQSADLVQKHTEHAHKQRVLALCNECASHKQEAMRVQHALDDKQTSLDMQLQLNQKLEAELQSAEQMAVDLNSQNSADQHSVRALVEYAHRLQAASTERDEKYAGLANTLQLYMQRITFASGRVELLQSQLSRREALRRVEEGVSAGPVDNEEKNKALVTELQHELERVSRERDSLARQGREDALCVEQRLAQSRASYEAQLQEARDEKSALQERVHLQTKEMTSAMESVARLEREKKEDEQRRNNMQTRIDRLQQNVDQEVLAAQDREREDHRQEVAALRQKLSDASREHSKTVVALRQLERQVARERVRMCEDGESREAELRGHVTRLETALRQSEKERNLLMVTLRQEGLVGRHRAGRASPLPLSNSDVTNMLNDPQPVDATHDFHNLHSFGDVTRELHHCDVTHELHHSDVTHESHDGSEEADGTGEFKTNGTVAPTDSGLQEESAGENDTQHGQRSTCDTTNDMTEPRDVTRDLSGSHDLDNTAYNAPSDISSTRDATRDATHELGDTPDPARDMSHDSARDPGLGTRDTFFEDTAESEQEQEPALEDVMAEVRLLSDEVLEDLCSDTSHTHSSASDT